MVATARAGVLGACAIVFASWFSATAVAAGTGTAAGSLSDDDKKCLECHSSADLKKDLGNGQTLPLHVQGEAFARSVHKALGCGGCHNDIDLAKHPGTTREIKDTRQHSIQRAEVCRQCHDDAYKQHQGSVHAERLRQGSAVAPVCTGCHGAHDVSPKTAYETCIRCHASALGAHQGWLPNAERHHEVVSCAACHAPTVLRMIDLRLYDRGAKKWVTEPEGSPQFDKLARSIDTDGNGLSPPELRNLLKEINRDTPATPKTLRGRVELRTAGEAHQLADKAKALRACDSCHRDGAEPFQNITVSITGPDGRPIRYRAHKEVVTSVLSVDYLREFYAVGGTRSRLLDVLFVLTLLAGVGVPIGHLTVRWLARRYRNR